MRTFELEDLTLFLIRDADEAEMWIDRWAVSYPVVQTAAASANQSIAQWKANIQTAFEGISGEHIAVVAHGASSSSRRAPKPSPTMYYTPSGESVAPAAPRLSSPNKTAHRATGRKNGQTCGTPASSCRHTPVRSTAHSAAGNGA